jgi:AmmeMemoRadiSam system protein B
MKPETKDIRPSPIAGTWYPGNPLKLRSSIEAYLAAAPVPVLPGAVVGLVVPHAGHIYSGPVAAHAFNTIKGKQFDTVVIVSPSHQYYREAILTSAHQAYATPLGTIPIDKSLVDAISHHVSQTLGFGMEPIANDEEHSLEIELPFLQVVLKQPFSLVPIMLRDQSPSTAHALADAIAGNIKGKNTLLVASSDLSHFHSETQANRLDQAILDQVAAFNPDGLYTVHAAGAGEACGLGAIATILWASHSLGADHVQVLIHNTSAAITGDTHSVVGYGAAVITSPA